MTTALHPTTGAERNGHHHHGALYEKYLPHRKDIDVGEIARQQKLKLCSLCRLVLSVANKFSALSVSLLPIHSIPTQRRHSFQNHHPHRVTANMASTFYA